MFRGSNGLSVLEFVAYTGDNLGIKAEKSTLLMLDYRQGSGGILDASMDVRSSVGFSLDFVVHILTGVRRAIEKNSSGDFSQIVAAKSEIVEAEITELLTLQKN